MTLFPSTALGRRQLLLLAAAGIAGNTSLSALAQTGTAAPVKIRYQCDWRFEAGTLPYVFALKKGYFAQEGLDVTLNVGSGASATITRLAAGNAEMGTGDMNSLAEFAGNNPQSANSATAVMLMYESTPAAVFSLKKTGIRKPSDLKGRKIGAPVNDGARRIFPLFAAANGLNPDTDVTWMSMEPAIRETMLARGQVDAITGYMASGFVSLQKLGVSPDDIDVMKFADYGVKLSGNAIFANNTFLKENPKAVAGFLRAVTRAMKEIIADRPAAVAVLKDFEPLTDARVEALRLDVLLDKEIGTANVRRNGIGDIDVARYQEGIDALTKALGIKSTPVAANLVNTSFLPPKAMRLVFPQ